MIRACRAAALALLAVGCNLFSGDPDRVIALEIVGGLTYSMAVNDTLQLHARARSGAGDTVVGATIEWAVLDTGIVHIALEPTTGTVVGLSAGATRVQAKVEDIRSDAITITVTAPPP